MQKLKQLPEISSLLLYALALLPLLSLSMVSISIGLFVFGSIWVYLKNKERIPIQQKPKSFIVFSLPFFLYVVSLLWTQNLELGLAFIGKTAFILIFPACAFLLRPFIKRIEIKRFIKVYIVSSVLTALFTIIFLALSENFQLIQKADYFSSIKLRQSIAQTPLIGEHPIYFSLIMAIALVFLRYNRFRNNYINITFVSLLVLAMLLASSKGVLASFFCAIFFMIFQLKRSKRYRVIISFIILSLALGAYFFPPIKARVDAVLNTKNLYPNGIQYNSYNTRVAIYACSFNIIKQAPVLGYGPGDVQENLDACYANYNTEAFDNQIFNTHNQYLDYLASFGLLGFGFISLSLLYFLRLAWQAKSKEYFSFLILMYLSFLTENILERNTGIVLFVTFNTLLAYDFFLTKAYSNMTLKMKKNRDSNK